MKPVVCSLFAFFLENFFKNLYGASKLYHCRTHSHWPVVALVMFFKGGMRLRMLEWCIWPLYITLQEAHQKSSLEQIFSADRQLLLAEVRDLRAHTNVSVLRHQEEKERLTEQLNSVEDQTSKRERQLKRQGKLVSSQCQFKWQGNLAWLQHQLKWQGKLAWLQFQL